MKQFLTLLLCGAAILLGAATSQAQTYQQVWADEFTNGIGPEWEMQDAGGWGNNERQYYKPANAKVVNGVLEITARKENMRGFNYTSARLETRGRKEFQYGRVEARIKMPQGQGLWPAFWMLANDGDVSGWDRCGEIDIMEHVNSENQLSGNIHYWNNSHAQNQKFTSTTPEDWHVYSIEWTPTFIKWFVDGAQFHYVDITNGAGSTEEFQKPFFILLNLAVGGTMPGYVVDDRKLPATMYVDYVRVYQQLTTPLPTPASILLQAEAADVNSGMQAEPTTDTGGGQDMTSIEKGDYLVFKNVTIPASGFYLIEYRVASPGGATLSTNLNAGAVSLGNTPIPATGGWQNWTTVSQKQYLTAGTYNLGIVAQTAGFNINWICLSSLTALGVHASNGGTNGADAQTISLYPNPQHEDEQAQVVLPSFHPTKPALVQVLDLNGREVWRTTATSATIKLAPTQRLSSGIYLVRISEGSGQHVQKLVVH